MRIIINHSSMIPIYEQIVDQIKKQINNHTLKENDALPSVRSLAKELQISALTVKKAYDFLENGGLTKTIHGKGTFVGKNVRGVTDGSRGERTASFRGETDSFVAL